MHACPQKWFLLMSPRTLLSISFARHAVLVFAGLFVGRRMSIVERYLVLAFT